MKIFLLLCSIIITSNLSAQNVGINTITPEGKLHIKGSADTSQLVIDANGTQNNLKPLIKLRNNSGTDLMWIHSDNPRNTFIGLNAGRVNNATGNPLGLYNTFIGSSAGYANTTGYANTANGYQAIYLNITGRFNTAMGYLALYSNTTGHANTAIGTYALGVNTVSYNTALGYGALNSNTTGFDNTATGAFALYSNSTASDNTAIGYKALETQSYNPGSDWVSGNVAVGNHALYANQPTSTFNGINNTAVGSNALLNNSTGFHNTANGNAALYSNNIGSYNTANGYSALYSNTSGGNNTANGNGALYKNGAGAYNTANGTFALYSNISGGSNTANGFQALYNNTGNFNTAIGVNSLYNHTSGNYNTAVGCNADVSLISLTNATAIGYGALVNGNNRVQIGNSDVLDVYFGNPSITRLHAHSVVPSDARFKYNIQHNVPGLEFIKRLQPVTYYFDEQKLAEYNKTGIITNSIIKPASYSGDKQLHTGFLAQDVEKIAKELGYSFDGVHAPATDKDYYSLAYSQFIIPLVKATQELNNKAEQLEKENAQLKKQVEQREIPMQIGKLQTIIEEQNKKTELQQQQINELLKEIQLIKEKLK